MIEYSLKLDSNPEFTSCVIVAYARAAYVCIRTDKKAARLFLISHGLSECKGWSPITKNTSVTDK